MTDWLDTLDGDERREWNRFVEHFRRDALEKIAGSAATVSIVPAGDDAVDVKFAVELGASIMLDKPILAVVMPGAEVPAKLRAVVDELVEADLDVEQGRMAVVAGLERLLARAGNSQTRPE